MSFTSDIRDELGHLSIKPLCCRRAYLYGLLYGAQVDGEQIDVSFPIIPGSTYDLPGHATSLIHALFGRMPTITAVTRGAHRYAHLQFSSKQAARHLQALIDLPDEEAEAETLHHLLEFKCDGCAVHFLRGLFIACGTVNDPRKSYHLEIKLPEDGRVEPARILLSENGYIPGRTSRQSTTGLFFKSGNDIQELLAYLGTTAQVFAFYNAQIERDIRNNENRATNCVTENIQRSMKAGSRQTAAIRLLDKRNLLLSLPDDLRYTAQLRLENPESTLVELAALHTPAITKSGLHHRLEKIMALYDRVMAQETHSETSLQED